MLELLRNTGPGWLPRKFGNSEPVRRSFAKEGEAGLTSAWHNTVLWVGTDPDIKGAVYTLPAGGHSEITVHMDLSPTREAEAITFLRHISQLTQADFGFLHSLTAGDIDRGRASRSVAAVDTITQKDWHLIVTGHQLREECLPDFYDINIFGRPYIDMFGHDRLLTTPAWKIEEISPDLVWVQTIASRAAGGIAENEIERRRLEAKHHLNCGAFFSLEQDGRYRVPTFA